MYAQGSILKEAVRQCLCDVRTQGGWFKTPSPESGGGAMAPESRVPPRWAAEGGRGRHVVPPEAGPWWGVEGHTQGAAGPEPSSSVLPGLPAGGSARAGSCSARSVLSTSFLLQILLVQKTSLPHSCAFSRLDLERTPILQGCHSKAQSCSPHFVCNTLMKVC